MTLVVENDFVNTSIQIFKAFLMDYDVSSILFLTGGLFIALAVIRLTFLAAMMKIKKALMNP